MRKILFIWCVCILAFFDTQGAATTFSFTGSAFSNAYTKGQNITISIPYTADGAFNAGNAFTVQLSNSSGSFASPVTIGTMSATAASGTLTFTTSAPLLTIPSGTADGSGYRIRIISSSPSLTSTNDNGFNIYISSCPQTPTKPSPFPASGSSNLGVSSGTTTTTGAMPSSAGNYILPSGSTSHTINTGNVGNAVAIYVQSGQTLSINYSYNINGGGSLTIYVDQGGTLNLNFPTGGGNTLNGGNFYIFGTLNLDIPAGIQNASNFYVVGSTASLVAPNKIYLTSSTGQFLVDGGSITTADIQINSVPAAEFCVKNFGCISAGDITLNNTANTFATADNFGYVYLSKSYTANPNQVLLNTSGLTPETCTGESSLNTKWCGANASCQARIKTSCSPSPATCAGAIALPITLTYFKAQKAEEGGVQIKWGTALEIALTYFRIERSTNGSDWTVVDKVDAKGGSKGSTYFTQDFAYSPGTNYYRLVTINTDGTEESTAVDVVNITTETLYFHVYPSPSDGNISVNVSDDFPSYTLEIVDLKGTPVKSFTVNAGVTSLTNVAKPGVYIAKLKLGHDMIVQRFVIQ